MENSMDMFIMAFGAIIFCVGITFLFMENKQINNLIDEQKSIIYENKTIY